MPEKLEGRCRRQAFATEAYTIDVRSHDGPIEGQCNYSRPFLMSIPANSYSGLGVQCRVLFLFRQKFTGGLANC